MNSKQFQRISEGQYVELWESLGTYESNDFGDFCTISGLSVTHGQIVLISSVNGNYVCISS